MQPFRTIALEQRAEITTIQLHAAGGSGEVDRALLEELERLMIWLEDSCSSPIVVFRGAGDVFCRGLSPAEFSPGRASIHLHNRWEKALIALERLPKLTIAAIDGPCVGAGVQLALACDHRIATSRALMQLPEVRQGYLPGMALFRLAKYVGLGVAKRLVLSGVPWRAPEALGWGLVDWACEPAALDETIAQVAELLLPAELDTVRLARRLLNEAYAEPVEDALGCLLAAQHRCLSRSEPPSDPAPDPR